MFGMQMGRMGQTGAASWLQTFNSLYANGEQGIAKLDFSDFTGMYQDRARTIPYTAVEQPLGSFTGLNGVTATAPADVNRGVVSARVNLLTKTEDFSNAAWTTGKTAGASVTSNTAIAPNGELTADTVTFDAPTDYLYQPISSFNAVAGSSIVLKYCSKVTGRLIAFGGATPAGVDVHIYIDIGGGWYEHKTTRTFSVSVTGTVQVIPNGNIVGAGSFALWGASLTLATDAHLPYQRVNTPTDYDTAGFSHYLAFNGTNTTYTTPSIDFTGTDKMTVWIGYGKTNDGPTSVLLETGSDYTGGGGIGVFSSNSSSAIFGVAHSDSGGNRFANVVSAATEVGVVAARYDLQTGALTSLRKNAAAWSSAGGASGGGMLGNRTLYIGARAGTSLFFNGRLYSLIVRGAESSISQIEVVETIIRQKMRLQ